MNQVAIESALTASATRVRSDDRTAHLGERLGLQHRRLRRQPQQRHARSRCRAGLLATDQHLTDALLERLDPLTDRRRRDVQPCRRGVEAAQLDDRGERRELLTVELTLAILMRTKND